MPEIQAFRGIRYDLGHVGSLGDVVAPPYDVIGPEFQKELYEKHPANCIRLILNRKEPTDDEDDNGYRRAGRFFKDWQSEGLLFTEADPAVYVYHQEFEAEGVTYVRRGFMARMRVSPFGEGQVFPHEETLPAAKVDRLMLWHVCRANMSQIFGLYPDPENKAQNLLEAAIAEKTPIETTDHLGVIHRLWPVTDVAVVSAVAAEMGPKPVFIADGHHRYETACKYREEIFDSGFLGPEHPANYVLAHCVAMEDPGLIVMPTHRLFKGIPAMTSEQLVARLGDNFTVRPGGEGPAAATELWEEIETADDQGTVALYSQKDHKWILATITDAGRARLAEVADDHNEEWRELGVAILHKLIVENLLGATDLPKPAYVHLVQEVIDGADDPEHALSALVMPAGVADIRSISLGGERMPAKSTYFYPKLLSGLVFNPLE